MGYQAVLNSMLHDMWGDEMTYASSIIFLFICGSAFWPYICGEVYIFMGYAAANWVPGLVALVFGMPALALASRMHNQGRPKEGDTSNRSFVVNSTVVKLSILITLLTTSWGFCVATMEIVLAIKFPNSKNAVASAGYLIGVLTVAIGAAAPCIGMLCQHGVLGTHSMMFIYGSVLSGLSCWVFVLPQILGLSAHTAIFWIFAVGCVMVGITTRFVLVPGPKVMADVFLKNGGCADSGFFLYQTMYTLGSGCGLMLGPPMIAMVGFEVCCMVLGLCLVLGAFLVRGMEGINLGEKLASGIATRS